MGLMSFLKFAFKCYDLLAWPLFGQGYPLYASIRAIENKSNQEMRNLVAYWILFSLVSLFELAFAKIINWIPLWCSMKLMATCFFVLPHFNGASYVYECLLRPCFSADPRGAIKYFIKPKEEKSHSAKGLLLVAERYAAENGSEALEKLLDRKSKHEEPYFGKVDARALEQSEKTPVAATKLSKVKEPSVGKENANTGQLKDKNPAVATEQLAVQVKCIEPNLAQNKGIVAAAEIREKTVAAAGGENKSIEITNSENVQREWACALCQVTIPCHEKNLDSHLKGRKHKAKLKVLTASEEVNENKGSSSSAASSEPKKTPAVDRSNKKRTKKQECGVHEKEVDITSGGTNQTIYRCSLCDVTLYGESNLASHLGGKKHLYKTQQHVKCVEPNLAQNKKNKVGVEAIKEKTVAAAGGEENKAQNENKVAAEAIKEKTVAAAGGEENKAQNKKEKVAAEAVQVETVAPTGGEENKAVKITDTEKDQRVRTWVLCQVTTTCKKVQGKERTAQEGDEKTQGPRAEAIKQAIKNTDHEMSHLLERMYLVGSGPTSKKFVIFLP